MIEFSPEKLREKNCNLAYQIRNDLLNNKEVIENCASKPSGEIEFFVRDYYLQTTSFRTTDNLMMDGVELELDSKGSLGFNQEGYETFVKMLFRYIRKNKKNFHYVTLFVNYRIGDQGTLTDLVIGVKEDRHHNRR